MIASIFFMLPKKDQKRSSLASPKTFPRVSNDSRAEHLKGQGRHERKKRPQRHARGEALPCGMPELGLKQPVAKKPMNQRALDVLSAREVTEVFAEFGTAPMDGFHCLREGMSWDLPAKIASDLFSAT